MTVLSRLPYVEVNYIGLEKGIIRSGKSKIGLVVDHDLNTAPESDILVIPGGPGIREILNNKSLQSFVNDALELNKWIASVCTGSLLLGAAGMLRGIEATTHWNALNDLYVYGATPVSKRVVIHDKIIMAAGVASGIDMALTLVSLIDSEETARAIQLKIEYAPDPPFNGGTPAKESKKVIELAQGGLKRKR
jgi:transcriptional regulator GlxA family with amidase domain